MKTKTAGLTGIPLRYAVAKSDLKKLVDEVEVPDELA